MWTCIQCITHPHHTQTHAHVHTYVQAAVFKHLYYQWQDYQNFTSGCNKEEIDSAITKFETQMRQLQAATRDANFRTKQEEERKKLSMPRFETAAEKEERMKKEVELAKFGEVAIAFRLSSPDPHSYTYYTELPGECHDEGVSQQQQQEVDTKKINKKRCQHAVDTQPSETFSYQTRQTATGKSFPWENIRPDPCVDRPMKTVHITRRSTDVGETEAKSVGTDSHTLPTTVTAMRLAGGRGGRRQRRSPPSAAPQSDKFSDPSTAESTQDHHSHLYSSRPVSGRNCGSKNKTTFRGKNRKKSPIVSNSKFLPRCTISMQISGTRGSPFSYGAGLPDDQQSHLSILSIT